MIYTSQREEKRDSTVTEDNKIAVNISVAFSGEPDYPLDGIDQSTIMHSNFSILQICIERSFAEFHLEKIFPSRRQD